MSEEISTAKREVFLAELAQTGNQTLAAERAGVTRSWVAHQRRVQPALGTDIADALARWAARRESDPDVALGVRWPAADGAAGARALTVQAGNRRLVQVARAKPNQWSPALEARFLAELLNSCNVSRACDAVGLTRACAYGHRKRWPDFMQRWDRALEDGYDALSFQVVAAAGAMLGDTDMVPEPGMAKPTFAEAMEALRLHQRRMRGEPCRRRWRYRPRTLDEVRGSILKKLEAIAAAERHEARLAGHDPDADGSAR